MCRGEPDKRRAWLPEAFPTSSSVMSAGCISNRSRNAVHEMGSRARRRSPEPSATLQPSPHESRAPIEELLARTRALFGRDLAFVGEFRLDERVDQWRRAPLSDRAPARMRRASSRADRSCERADARARRGVRRELAAFARQYRMQPLGARLKPLPKPAHRAGCLVNRSGGTSDRVEFVDDDPDVAQLRR
jgi:hypothetical protein